MMMGVGDQPSAHCLSNSGHHSIAPMRGSSIRPSGLGPGIPGRNAHPSTGTRLPSRLSSRGPEWPRSRASSRFCLFRKARAVVFHEVQPRSSLQLGQYVQYGRLHPEKMLANDGMGEEQSLIQPQSSYLGLTGSRHITSSLPLFFTLLFLSESRTSSLSPLHL